jgi:hypothetical protein
MKTFRCLFGSLLTRERSKQDNFHEILNVSMYPCSDERMYNMKNKRLLASVFTALAAMAIAFFVSSKEANPGFVSVLTFMLVFLGASAFFNLINRRKGKKEESSASE